MFLSDEMHIDGVVSQAVAYRMPPPGMSSVNSKLLQVGHEGGGGAVWLMDSCD